MEAEASNGTSDIYEGNPTPTTSRGGMVCGSRDEDEQVQQQREAIVTAPLPATGFANRQTGQETQRKRASCFMRRHGQSSYGQKI